MRSPMQRRENNRMQRRERGVDGATRKSAATRMRRDENEIARVIFIARGQIREVCYG